MPTQRVPLWLVVLTLLAAGSMLLGGCTAVDFDQFSFEAGRQARQLFDAAMHQLGEFVAGFCSGASLPAAAAVVAVLLWRRR